ncbi:tetratricopeptide repeat-containing sensor histidine kinase [Flavobacterium sedimenticola]|uniref:Oxygen sensor histidine kinase NreB n=1 Tax=Flavobacterium sedimenticola TaxID=3043286 RepID=A0ABT6XTF2_9FLAO|nr:sensor histidine kinase [Flavobacterium sedimenticola]MDI9257884.1 sensor histidine kinase [Flavobacterium sedimenticola]
MKKILTITIVFFVQFAIGQRFNTLYDDDKFIDSLLVLIKTAKSDSIKASNSFKLAELYRRNKDIKKFYYFLRIGNQNAKKYPFLKDCSNYHSSFLYLIQRDVDTFLEKITKANEDLVKYDNTESYVLRASIAINLSIINQIRQNDKEAIRILVKEGIPLARKGKDYEQLAVMYENLGIIFMNNSDRERAANYFKQSILFLDKASKSSYSLEESKVECYIMAAENYIHLNEFSRAGKLLDDAYKILINHPRNNLFPIYYYPKGLYYFKIRAYDSALINYEKGIKQSILHRDTLSLNRLVFSKVRVFNASGKYSQAKDVMLALLKDGDLFTEDKKKLFKELGWTYEKLEDFEKANYYNKKYILLADSLNQSNTRIKISELEAKFNKSENENRIRQLNAQNEKSLLMAQNSRLKYVVFISISIILLVLLIFISLHFRNKHKLAQERDLMNRQKIHALERQKEIDVMRAMIDGEELERKRMARELHDGIGSKLSALKIALDRLGYLETDQQKLLNINTLLSSSITEVRQISYNLVPESLLRLGLDNALGDLCHLLYSDDVRIEYQSFGIEQDMAASKQLNIYRIVQELVNNALKHSNCSEILVSCSQTNSLFFISVEDNGIGFSWDELVEGKGLGLKNLESRVKLLNGTMNVDSGKNGTTFNIELLI